MKQKLIFGFKLVYLFGLIGAPIVLLLLPKDYFDYGQSVCLSKSLFQLECLGCGMTRAIQHLIHFDFNSAADYNRLSFIVLPILIYIWSTEILRMRKQILNYKQKIRSIE